MASKMVQVIFDLIDNFSGEANKISSSILKLNSKIDILQSNIDSISSSASTVGKSFLSIGIPLAGLGVTALKVASDVQTSQIAFETMLGSAEEASTFMQGLIDFAKRTPFELSGITESAKKLLAYGVESQNVLRDLEALGDIASAVGMDKLPQLTTAYGQVITKGRLMSEEILQFTEAGVPLVATLAAQFGVSALEMQKMVTAGQVTSSAVTEALINMTEEGGKFDDLMNKQAGTVSGKWSNAIDGMKMSLGELGKQLIPYAVAGLDKMNAAITSALSAWSGLSDGQKDLIVKIGLGVTAFTLFAGGALMAISAIASFASSVVAIKALVMSLGLTMETFAFVFSAPFLIATAAIVGLIAIGYALYTHWAEVSAFAQSAWSSVSTAVQNAFIYVQTTITGAMTSISAFLTSAWQTITGIFNFGVALITGLVIAGFRLMGVDIVTTMTGISTGLQAFWAFATQLFTTMQGLVSTGWDMFLSFIQTTLDTYVTPMEARLTTFGSWVSGIFESVRGLVSTAWSGMWSGISSVATSIAGTVKSIVSGMLNWIIDKINTVIRSINAVAQAGAKVTGASIGSISEIPALAKGGIVNSPTLALIGEAGPEAVVPLSGRNAPGGFGGGATININWTGAVSEDAAAMVAKQIMKELGMNTSFSMV